MDDVVAVQKNLDVVTPQTWVWNEFMRHDFWGLDMFSGDWTHKSFRPLTTLSYRANWLTSGLDTSAFHATNVVLHSVASGLVVILCQSKFGMGTRESAATALLFAMHPVHTESVLYLVGRAYILCFIFMALAILSYSDRASTFRLTLSHSLVLASGFSKELGFMTFFTFLAMDLIRFRLQRTDYLRLVSTLVVAMVSISARHWYTDGTSLKMSPQDNPISFEENPFIRWLSYAVVHSEYARLLIFPYFLCYDYSMNTIPLVTGASDVRLLASIATYSAFCFVLWRAMRDTPERRPLILGVSFFFFSFIPMSNIFFPVGTVVGERLLYIPSLGFLVSLVLLCPKRIKWFLLTVIGTAYLLRTYYRIDDWKTAENLTLVDGLSNPNSAKTQYNLGVQYFTKQRYDEAVIAFRRSIATDELERDGVAHWRAGQAELLRGNLDEAEKLLVAATHKYGARLMVREEEIFHDAGLALYHNRKIDGAKYHLTAALSINRKFPKALNNMGCLLMSTGESRVGLELIREASSLKPKNVIYSGNVWIVAHVLGNLELAESAKNHTLAIQPSFVPATHCVWEFKPAEGGPLDSAMND